MFYIPVFGFSILFLIAIVWILIHYRGAFVCPVCAAAGGIPDAPGIVCQAST